MSSTVNRRALTFRIVGDVLYVANFGRRFDRPGVVSVCRENLSAKTSRGPGASLDDVPDRGLVDAIRERRLNVYREDIDQLQEDANHERETSSDYAGRTADRFIHVVQVTQDHLDTLDVDGDGLPRLRARISGQRPA